jgi:hypothetical protein
MLHLLFRYTLNNVVFGIALMVSIGLYVGIGSGRPDIRSYFEMSDLEFFNAWPLKTLMLLLCLNLAVVTWNRIPLTPPRYGVWCIHAGIITLIVGMSLYYHLKVEGRTLIQINHTVNVFYDTSQRALYVRAMNRPVYAMQPLPSLPRFGTYAGDGAGSVFDHSDLKNIGEMVPLETDSRTPVDVSTFLGLGQKVRLDVVGFYPYADLAEDVSEDPGSSNVGVELKMASPHGDAAGSTLTLCAADSGSAKQVFGTTELEHRNVSPESLAMIKDSAAHLLRISVTLPNQPAQAMDVQLGKTYDVAGTGYSITIDSFDPAFQTIGTQEIVPEMMVHVVSHAPAGPEEEFWRSLLQGSALQTDFKMDPATTPPMVKGNRQKEPIDKNLVLNFRFDDPAGLMPTNGDEKQTFITSTDSDLLAIDAAYTHATQVTDLSSGGQVHLNVEGTQMNADVRRLNHVKITTHVVETLPARRVKDIAESGEKQVLVVRVTAGNWSGDVDVPCDIYAAPDPMTQEPTEPWALGVVKIPGESESIQLQLGYTCRPMPALLSLKRFELVHYPGGTGDNGPFRDFRSTLEITEPSGERNTDVASLNSPIYYDGGKWIFFQAGYDPAGQFSTIGVGNRPAVGVMITGCVMIVSGLMYTFYVKPTVVRRMKAKALERIAAEKQKNGGGRRKGSEEAQQSIVS